MTVSKSHSIFFLFFILLFSLVATASANTKDIFSQYKNSLLQIRIVDVATDSKTIIGSGFFVNSSGLIATNYHVISKHVFEPKQYRIEYVLPGNTKTKKIYQARLVNFDVIHDLALLTPIKVLANKKTPYLRLQDTPLKKGEKIFSIGNPHDLGMAIITGTYNGFTDDSMNKRILLSSAINPGMSGGPSITAKGKVIGINVATAGNQIGFLVPVKYLKLLINNKNKSHDFIAYIGKQILANQNIYISSILNKPFKIKKLGEYQVPDKLANYLTCWGDSESKDLPYKISENSCATKNDIFIADNFTTGDIHYSRYYISAKKMNIYRFAYIQENLYKAPDVYLTGRKKDFTNYKCKTDFVKNNNITFKVSFCLRGYKHFKGLYDMTLSAASLSEKTTAIQTNLILAGVSYKNAILFSKKYLRAFSWAP